MDSYEVFYDEYENGFVIKKNDYVYARIPDRRDLEHFLTVLVKSTTVMPEVEINDDVFNEDWNLLFFRIVFTEEDGIRLVPFEFDERIQN